MGDTPVVTNTKQKKKKDKMKIQNSTVSKCKTFVAAVFIIYNIDKK